MINSDKKRRQNYLRLYTSMTVPCIFIETRGTSNPQVSPQNWKAITSWLPSFPNFDPPSPLLFSYPIFLFKEFSNLRATFVLKHCFLHPYLLHLPSLPGLIFLLTPSRTFSKRERDEMNPRYSKERKEKRERARSRRSMGIAYAENSYTHG